MNAMLPLPGVIIFLLYTCLSALILSTVDASFILNPRSKQARLSTAYQQRQSSSSDGRGRLSFEECDLSQCELPRTCKLVAVPDIACSGAEACHCLPSDIVQCSSHIHCVEGEVCAQIDNFGTVCASESFVDQTEDANRLPGENPSPPPFPSEKGFTFDPCRPDSCQFPRFCKTIVDEQADCRGDLACHCVPNPLTFCSSSRECVVGETCASVPERGDVCVSDSFLNHTSPASPVEPVEPVKPADNFGQEPPISTPEEDEEESGDSDDSLFGFICIGVEFLEHLPREALRFKDDNVALVLCDEHGSCATPGHMVVYRGEGMMMVSYCKHVICNRRMMNVNSPRYRRGMTIPSRTTGLTFTVFAARYGTFTEEKILKVALRLGL